MHSSSVSVLAAAFEVEGALSAALVSCFAGAGAAGEGAGAAGEDAGAAGEDAGAAGEGAGAAGEGAGAAGEGAGAAGEGAGAFCGGLETSCEETVDMHKTNAKSKASVRIQTTDRTIIPKLSEDSEVFY